MVGMRHPTPYRLGVAEPLACDLTVPGLVIISGMARGGQRCHFIAGRSRTKAKRLRYFGTGVDVIYLKENSRLSEQILALGGALISKFCMGAFAVPQNLPIRNRILSGMSVGVLVVEAAEYSGTRLTPACGLEQTCDVFAVPGNVTNKNSWGPEYADQARRKAGRTWENAWTESAGGSQARAHSSSSA